MVLRRVGTSLPVILVASVLLSGCSSQLRQAERLAAGGDWDGAVAMYRDLLKKDPLNETLVRRVADVRARAAEAHYEQGKMRLKDKHLAEALHEFKTALSLDPSRAEYHAALADAVRGKEAVEQVQTGQQLESLGRIEEALQAYEKAVELQPDLNPALEQITKLSAAERAESPLGSLAQPVTLRFQNTKLKEVFEVLARAGNINVVFDREVKDEPITIFIKEASFEEALNLILSTNNLFGKRLGKDTVLVIPNTKQKQDQYQDQAIRTFYLSTAKAKDMATLLKTMLDSKRMVVNEQINAIVIRDQPDKIKLAERIIFANDRRESEVEFDFEVLELTRTKKDQYGFNFGKTAGAGIVPPGVGSLSSNSSTFSFKDLVNLGTGSYLFSIPTTILMDFFRQQSDAKTLASPKLRVLNGKQASVNIGDKQPILLSTSNVLPGTTFTGAFPTTSTVTSIEFKDTGVKLTVEPTIHLVNELSLKLKIEVTKIGDQVTLQASPEIKQFRFGTRVAETVLNMKDGESVILAGLIQDEDRKTVVTVPGLGDIPVLGKLFSSNTIEAVTTEVVLTITPHLVRNLNTPSVGAQTFWSGTETNYSTAPLYSDMVHKFPAKTSSRPQYPAADAKIPAAPASANSIRSDSSGAPTWSGLHQPGGHLSDDGESSPADDGRPALTLEPKEISGYAGQEFRVDVAAVGVRGVHEAMAMLAFDPNVLEFRKAEEGEFFREPGRPSSLRFEASPRAGRLELSLGRRTLPLTGTGVLASLVFKAKRPGISKIEILKGHISGHEEEQVAFVTSTGLIRVR